MNEYFSRGSLIYEQSKNFTPDFEPSSHFKNLVSIASEYVKEDLGKSYNFREIDSQEVFTENTSYATGKGGGFAGLIHFARYADPNTKVYYRSVTGKGLESLHCDIPHNERVPARFSPTSWKASYPAFRREKR